VQVKDYHHHHLHHHLPYRPMIVILLVALKLKEVQKVMMDQAVAGVQELEEEQKLKQI
jgi:hypothetical protein